MPFGDGDEGLPYRPPTAPPQGPTQARPFVRPTNPPDNGLASTRRIAADNERRAAEVMQLHNDKVSWEKEYIRRRMAELGPGPSDNAPTSVNTPGFWDKFPGYESYTPNFNWDAIFNSVSPVTPPPGNPVEVPQIPPSTQNPTNSPSTPNIQNRIPPQRSTAYWLDYIENYDKNKPTAQTPKDLTINKPQKPPAAPSLNIPRSNNRQNNPYVDWRQYLERNL